MGAIHRFRVGLAAFGAFTALGGAAPLRADLAPSSPFRPLDGTAAAAAGQAGPAGPVELRGIMSSGDGVAYCIYDTAKRTSTWARLNESGYDFLIRSADPANESVTVDFQGRSLRLILRAAKVASAGQAAAPGPAAAPVVLNPSPADEQRRLDAVAQEVRRRQLERARVVQRTPPPGTQP